MIQQRKFSLFLLVLLFFSAWSAKGQCPNNYSINIASQPYCQNYTNGYLTLQGTTYYSGSTYIWSNGATSRNLNSVTTGHYSVTITDPTTCTYTATTYLATSPVGIPTTIYFDACQRQLYAYASTNNPTYLWSDGSTNYDIQDPAPGVYSVTVTDIGGCTGTATHTVLPYASAISATHASTPATCNASNGSVDVTVTGGTLPYTYYWYDGGAGQTVEDAVNLPAGIATVRIRDANNCYLWYDVNIGGPKVMLPSVAYTSCGLTNATLTATTQSMSNPTFIWSNGATSAIITGLTTGTYAVTATDGACVVTATASVYNGGYVNVVIADSTQTGCTIDELSAYAYGGSYTYTYLWSTGETTETISLQAGISTYIVTATDANGCMAVDTIVTNGMAAGGFSFTSVVQDATCGNSDGAINLTVINGPANTYLWSPTGATTEDISGIAAGHHIVQATNWNGCVYTDTIAVGEFIEFSSTDASCGLNNGSATVYDFGMTNPTFLWSNGATVRNINNLAAGNYTVTVTNGSCVISESVTITDAGQLVAGIFAPTTCAPSYIAGMPTGGAAPFSYVWNTGAIMQSIANPIPANTYDITITDANGCTASATYTVPNPPAITATYVSTDATCNNKNGEIDLTVTGGTAPFNFAWSLGNANVEDIVGLWPGQYSVSISDNNGCVLRLYPIVVGGQTAIAVSQVLTNVNAANTGGAINITVTGVTSATYQWSNGATSQDISNLSSGHYQVTITDLISGCVFTRLYYLSQPFVCNPVINTKINGAVYDVSATGTCQPGLPLPYKMVILQPLGLVDFTNAYGYYEFNITAPGNYTVEYVNTTPLTTTVICPATGSYAITGATLGNTYSNNFYLTNPPVQDLSLNLWDYSNATPGFPYYTRISYCNDGNTNMNGTVEYDYNSLLGFLSITGWNSTLTLHDIPNHKFYWSFSNLMPAACRSVDVQFTVPNTTALGTSLVGTATVFPTAGDATPANNTDTEQTTVVGSWDPNDKQVDLYHTGDAWTGGVIYETEEELEYTIRFQNTGTAPANIVVIRDTLDANLLPETVREISTKHDADVTLENGNILVFTFNNIYLPDSSADFGASMGFVKFKINRIAGLPVGTEIENTAAIYFDFNEPIITNTPISIIDMFNSVVDIDNSGLTVETMPNPFNEQLTLKYTLQQSSDVTIRVMNAMGQTVYTHVAGQSQQNGVYIEQLRMNDLPSGMYLLSVETGEAIVTKKIVKE